jgi:parallel beta-helix repeat protein
MTGAAIDRRKRRGAAVAAAALACLVVPFASPGVAAPQGPGKVVVSKPGPGAISEAIAAVQPGGKVKIRKGRYRESLLIEKPVRLIAAGKGRPTIDGICQFPSTITIHSGGVVLKGIKVVGAGTHAAVDFSGVPSGRADDLRVKNTCEAEYGINVFSTGAVEITDNRATGFTDAGIYVGDITSTPNGTLFVGDNVTYGNNKGVIVEFSAGGDIAVFSNEIHDNNIPGVGEQVGLFVFDSDGVRIQSNRIRANGQTGLVLTPGADNNAVSDNEITGNPVDVRNEGAGNCGSGNTFATGGPLSPC